MKQVYTASPVADTTSCGLARIPWMKLIVGRPAGRLPQHVHDDGLDFGACLRVSEHGTVGPDFDVRGLQVAIDDAVDLRDAEPVEWKSLGRSR